jgi:protein-tyrosine phosphatase
VVVKYSLTFIVLAMVLAVDAVMLAGPFWVLLWPALCFLLVGTAYAGLGPRLFGKRSDGRMNFWAVILLLPYLLITWGTWHLLRLLSREDCWNEIAPGLFMGRRGYPSELPAGITLVVDLTCEFPEPRGICEGREYLCLPILDASSPDETALRGLIERIAAWSGTVYVHCAQGHGRSGLVMAAVLLARNLAPDAAEAVQQIKRVRPKVRLTKAQRELLLRLQEPR